MYDDVWQKHSCIPNLFRMFIVDLPDFKVTWPKRPCELFLSLCVHNYKTILSSETVQPFLTNFRWNVSRMILSLEPSWLPAIEKEDENFKILFSETTKTILAKFYWNDCVLITMVSDYHGLHSIWLTEVRPLTKMVISKLR